MPRVTYKGLGDKSRPIPAGCTTPFEVDRNGNAVYWVVRGNERRIRITDMTDIHIIRTLNMLERNAPAMQEAEISDAWWGLSMLQGEMATYYAERELDAMMEEHPLEALEHNPAYRALIFEAVRRDIREDLEAT